MNRGDRRDAIFLMTRRWAECEANGVGKTGLRPPTALASAKATRAEQTILRTDPLSDAFFGTATEEHAVGEDDGHDAFVFQEMEAVEQEGEIGGGLGREAVVLEAHVVSHRVGGVPAVAEGRIRDDGVEVGLLGGVQLAQHFPIVELANPLDKFELGIRKLIESLMIERMGENDKIVTRYMADQDFQSSAFPILAKEIFEAVRGRTAAQAASAEPRVGDGDAAKGA